MRDRGLHLRMRQREPLRRAPPNLDEAGIELVKSVVADAIGRGKVVIVATNDEREVSMCSSRVYLGDYL